MAALSTLNQPSEPMNAAYYNTQGTRLIRNPNPADVIAGRGGSVNSHPGNVQFREWVADRKTAYNLAMSKERKAVICRDVIQLVQAAGGRFLGRDKNTSFWLELDDERIMAKTSQALREGAPKIREAHKEELGNAVPFRRRRKGRSRPSHPPRELTPSPPSKRIRIRSPHSNNGNKKKEEIITPPVQSNPQLPILSLREESMGDDEMVLSQLPPPLPPLPRPLADIKNKINNNMPRTHSLAFSDISFNHDDFPEEFVNPFEDESELLGRAGSHGISPPPPPSELLRHNSSPLSPPQLGILRESSNNLNHHTYSNNGAGNYFHNNNNSSHDALFQSQDSAKSNHSFGSFRYAPATTTADSFFNYYSNEEDGVMGMSLDWAAEDREWTQRAVSPYLEEEDVDNVENRNEEIEASLIDL
jgi:hypothetical protein